MVDKIVVRTALHKVPVCGCGNPEVMWDIVRALLERAGDHDKHGYFTDPLLSHDLSSNAVQFIAHVLDHAGMMEHGGGIGGAWLSEAGHIVLGFLSKYGPDSGDTANPIWPDWAWSCDSSEQLFLSPEQWRPYTRTPATGYSPEIP